jgi:hypothetical protein
VHRTFICWQENISLRRGKTCAYTVKFSVCSQVRCWAENFIMTITFLWPRSGNFRRYIRENGSREFLSWTRARPTDVLRHVTLAMNVAMQPYQDVAIPHVTLPALFLSLPTTGMRTRSASRHEQTALDYLVTVVLFLFDNVICVYLLLWLCILIVCLCMTTLTEVFPCFFLSRKVNARVKPAKTGHGPHSS